MNKKVKNLDDKAYADFIKDLVGDEVLDLNEPQKED